jgi:TetR/AcrR family transcriptional repressor of nem operon
MRQNGIQTRTQLLDAAESLFLSHGYGGASVDAILERAGLSKGAFFHHFTSKAELAHALIERYAEADRDVLTDSLARAERLSRDPLQQVLILVGLYEEMLSGLAEPYPGCLFATYCYQAGLFDEPVHTIVRDSMTEWRTIVGGKLREAMERHPTALAVDADDLADALLAVIEGSFVLSKSLKDPELVVRQLRHYRNYLELLFRAV